jgi:hypothetical protein
LKPLIIADVKEKFIFRVPPTPYVFPYSYLCLLERMLSNLLLNDFTTAISCFKQPDVTTKLEFHKQQMDEELSQHYFTENLVLLLV